VSAYTPAGYINRIVDSGPVTYLPLTQTSGLTAIDQSGNGHNGALTRTSWESTNQTGWGASCMHIPAGYYQTGAKNTAADMAVSGGFTVMLATYIESYGNPYGASWNLYGGGVYENLNIFGAYQGVSGAVQVINIGRDSSNMFHVAGWFGFGEWVNTIYTKTAGGAAALYRNGAADTSGSHGASIDATGYHVGGDPSSADYYSRFQHFTVWTRVLSTDEIADIGGAAMIWDSPRRPTLRQRQIPW
jgi:hypothetical protein